MKSKKVKKPNKPLIIGSVMVVAGVSYMLVDLPIRQLGPLAIILLGGIVVFQNCKR